MPITHTALPPSSSLFPPPLRAAPSSAPLRQQETSYPFACAAINIVYMLADVMKLKRPGGGEARSNEPGAVQMRATCVLCACYAALYVTCCLLRVCACGGVLEKKSVVASTMCTLCDVMHALCGAWSVNIPTPTLHQSSARPKPQTTSTTPPAEHPQQAR